MREHFKIFKERENPKFIIEYSLPNLQWEIKARYDVEKSDGEYDFGYYPLLQTGDIKAIHENILELEKVIGEYLIEHKIK